MEELTEEEAQTMLAKLEKHYHQPVMPISKFCEAISTWFELIRKNCTDPDLIEGDASSQQGYSYYDNLEAIEKDIRKSNFLARILYGKQKIRTQKCPEHKGHWSGWSSKPCEHGCSSGVDVTGWLPA